MTAPLVRLGLGLMATFLRKTRAELHQPKLFRHVAHQRQFPAEHSLYSLSKLKG